MIPLSVLKIKRQGTALAPFLLGPESELNRIAELAKHFLSLVGTKYSEFNEEKPVEIVGDYKLAKSVQSVLNKYFFAFKTVPFEEAVGIGVGSLNSGPVKSYADLRLFIFSLLGKGFTKKRGEIYERANRELGASLDFDSVLWLDHPDNRILVKLRDFDVQSFIGLYNSEVLDTVFSNSTSVVFELNAFNKKVFYVCKRNGLLFDIWKEGNRFVIRVFGPVELFGKPTKYGYRIASAAPQLIPYSERLSAVVRLKSKDFTFSIDSASYGKLVVAFSDEADPEFDSFPEQEFFDYFRSNTEGWVIEREPEPVLQGDIIFVPDFCVTRGNSKVFVEIIGFWTKDYQEKKLRKLSKLKGVNLILVVSDAYEQEAKKKLADLGCPLLFCDFGRIGAITTGIIRVLEENYSDFKGRYSGVNEEVKKRLEVLISTQKYVLMPELKKMFNTFTDAELRKVFLDYAGLVKAVAVAVEGVGFFSEEKLYELKQLAEKFNGRPREELVSSLDSSLRPYADPLLYYFGYAVKWKSLGDAVIIRQWNAT